MSQFRVAGKNRMRASVGAGVGDGLLPANPRGRRDHPGLGEPHVRGTLSSAAHRPGAVRERLRVLAVRVRSHQRPRMRTGRPRCMGRGRAGASSVAVRVRRKNPPADTAAMISAGIPGVMAAFALTVRAHGRSRRWQPAWMAAFRAPFPLAVFRSPHGGRPPKTVCRVPLATGHENPGSGPPGWARGSACRRR